MRHAVVDTGRAVCPARFREAVSRRVQLGLVACHLRPRACQVVRHEVEVVEVHGSLREVDVAEQPLARGQRRREDVPRAREVPAKVIQEMDEMMALRRVLGVLPVNYK